jgi:hypothetical protein
MLRHAPWKLLLVVELDIFDYLLRAEVDNILEGDFIEVNDM